MAFPFTSFTLYLNELGPQEAFVKTYGMTMSEFVTEFDKLVELDIEEQLLILP